MSRQVQAEAGGRRVRGTPWRAAITLICCSLAAGCASGMSLDKVEADSSILTSSTGAAAVDKDRQTASDEATIRNAVSSAYLEEIPNGRIPWSNLDTGSRGEISEVEEYQEKGVLCRRFTTSRESFSGVDIYKGDTCLGSGGQWWMRLFARS